jgi:hypothetical protein
MKKIVLSVCVTGAALAGLALALSAATAAGASAPTFNGTCTITGISTFFDPSSGQPAALTGSPAHLGYNFKSGAPGQNNTTMQSDPDMTECQGTLNGKQVDLKAPNAAAAVKGVGELSCATGGDQSPTDPNNDPPGSGYLQLTAGGVTYQFPFAFTFAAGGPEVSFTTDNGSYGGGTQAGTASFAAYAPPTTPVDCSPAGSGVKQLGFSASDNGPPSAPFVGKCVSGCPGGTGSGTTGTTTTITTTATTTTTAPSHPSKPRKPSAQARCLKKAKRIKSAKRRRAAVKRCARVKRRG